MEVKAGGQGELQEGVGCVCATESENAEQWNRNNQGKPPIIHLLPSIRTSILSPIFLDQHLGKANFFLTRQDPAAAAWTMQSDAQNRLLHERTMDSREPKSQG
jgi:hypothetical protein